MRYIDLTGERFRKLVVLHRAENHITTGGNSLICSLCQCDCGNTKVVLNRSLISGKTKSCGCHYIEALRKRRIIPTYDKKLYRLYHHMKARCCRPTTAHYNCYGGRGIKVCNEWLNNYEEFSKWAKENGYKEGLQIDRIDNDGDYTPDNCRFVTAKVNSNNKRNNRRIELNGTSYTLQQWADKLGISHSTLRERLESPYWNIYEALTTPATTKTQHLGGQQQQ